MKSLTIVSTYSPRYFPLPVTKSLETTAKNWPSHAKILVYPDNMSQTLPADKEINQTGDRFEYYNLCKEQPSLQNFIDRHTNNPKLQTLGMKDYEFEYDAIRFSYKVFACIDAYQKTKPDMMWYLDADIITFEPVPMSWLEHIIPDHAFTSYLGRPKKGFSETGYYAFNTAHEFAEEFFKRWQQYYDEDLFFNIQKGFLNSFPRAGYTDSFTFDAVRIEMEQAGKIKNEDLNDGRFGGARKARHPFINSELGQYMDHLKGFERKDQMKSKKSDLTTNQTHAYWKDLK